MAQEAKVRIWNPTPTEFDPAWGERNIVLDGGRGVFAIVGKQKDGPVAVKTYVFGCDWDMDKAMAWIEKRGSHEVDLSKVTDILASDSIMQKVTRIREAYYGMVGDIDVWVRDIFDDYVVVQEGSKLYKVPYSLDGSGNVIFDTAAKKEVKTDYVELSEEYSESDLVWKQLLRPGKWSKQEATGKTRTINIDWGMIEAVKAAFDAGVNPHVAVPCEHTDSPRENTGFVKALKIVKGSKDKAEDGLWCGILFTEPDIQELVQHGTIADVSAYVTPQWVDSRDGKTWPWVLVHVALTNLPVLHLKPFAASSGADEDEIYSREVVEVDQEEKRQLEARIQGLQEELARETGQRQDLEAKLGQASTSVEGLQSQLAQHRVALHSMEVKSILAAYQGKGEHDRVKVPAKMALAPAVLSVVEPILMADETGDKSIALSVGSEEKASVTDIVLGILNAVAGAGSALVSMEPKGSQDHSFSQPKVSEDDKAKAVDAYLASRHLAPVDEA